MLRRRLSTGLLRSQPIVARTAIPPVPALPARYAASNRGLASAVLLSSRENWANKTIKNLKEALAQRGLSQSGKKSALVERLKEYETSQSSTSGSRGISSSAIAFKSSTKTQDQAPAPELPKVEVASGVEANVNNVAEIEVPDVEPALAPGLPEAKSDLTEAPPTLDIKMPEFEDNVVQNATPPFDPHNFESKAEDSLAAPAEIESAVPKVMTVVPNDATRHSLHETVSADNIDVASADTVVTSSKEALDSIPPLSSLLTSIPIPSLGGLGDRLAKLVKVPEGKTHQGDFKPIDRGLNSEEKTGAYILVGTIALGFLLGGGRKEEHEDKDVKEHVNEAAQAAAH